MSNDNNSAHEQRKQRRLQALGTNTPGCALCGEDRWQTLEQHHPAGQAHDAATIIICRNCHRVLSDAQRDQPNDPNPADPELMASGRFLLGLADPRVRRLARKALGAALRTAHFSTSGDAFEFGARSRSHGWRPRTVAEQRAWFVGSISRLDRIAQGDDDEAAHALHILARATRGLSNAACVDLVVVEFERQRSRGFQLQLWKSVCETLFFDRKGLRSDVVQTLDSLEAVLRPQRLAERFQAYVLGGSFDLYPPAGSMDEPDHRRNENISFELGAELASHELLSEYVLKASSSPGNNLFAFGRGIARASAEAIGAWQTMCRAFEVAPEALRNPTVLGGFLNEIHTREPSLTSRWLDEAAGNRALVPFVVYLTCVTQLDDAGVLRLIRLLQSENALDVRAFSQLQIGGVTHEVDPEQLSKLLTTLGGKGVEGTLVALDVLHMRFFGERKKADQPSSHLVRAGAALLNTPGLIEKVTGAHDYAVSEVVGIVIKSGAHDEVARRICSELLQSGPARTWHSRDLLVRALASYAPRLVLDVIEHAATDRKEGLSPFLALFEDADGDGGAPLESAGPDLLLAWVRENPVTRAPLIAELVRCYTAPDESADFKWTPVVRALLDLDPLPDALLDELEIRFQTGSWSGSTAQRHRRQKPLVSGLLDHPNPVVRAWAAEMMVTLERWIEREERWDRGDEERFE